VGERLVKSYIKEGDFDFLGRLPDKAEQWFAGIVIVKKKIKRRQIEP